MIDAVLIRGEGKLVAPMIWVGCIDEFVGCLSW